MILSYLKKIYDILHVGTVKVDGSSVTQPVSGTVTATGEIDNTIQTTGSAVKTKSVLAGLRDTSGNQRSMQGYNANADGITSPSAGNLVGADCYIMVYNGATWDRLRGTIAGGILTRITNGTNIAAVDSSLRLQVFEAQLGPILTALYTLVDVIASPVTVFQIDKAAVDGDIFDLAQNVHIHWMTITNYGTAMVEFNLRKAAAGDILFHLAINPGVTLQLTFSQFVLLDLGELYYDYIAGASPLLSFSVAHSDWG